MKVMIHRISPKSAQQGVGTLIFSILILMLITLVSFRGAKGLLVEQTMNNNDVRAKQAFEAAEAGMARAYQYYASGADQDEDLNVDVNIFLDDAGNAVSSTVIDGRRVEFALVGDTDDLDLYTMQVTGYSDDLSARRTITETLGRLNPLPNSPQNPMVSRGSVVIAGSATVTNPEGFSTIWSGGDVNLGSNNATATNIPDMGDGAYPVCMDTPETCVVVSSSNKDLVGLDVLEYDQTLANLTIDELFINFFGMSPQRYRATHATIDTDAANVNTEADLAEHQIIWVEGDANLSGFTMGCSVSVSGNNTCPVDNQKPSIMIVNGNVTFSGTPHFYGILFIMGNANAGSNVTVHGAVVIAGDTGSSGGGSLDIIYNSDILEEIGQEVGSRAGGAGTWRDF